MIETLYLKPSEVTKLINVSKKTLADWRKKDIGPNFIKSETGSIFYETKTVINYMEKYKNYTSG